MDGDHEEPNQGGPARGGKHGPSAREVQKPSAHEALHPAGPHADPRLTNPDATPGTGALPSEGAKGKDADAASG